MASRGLGHPPYPGPATRLVLVADDAQLRADGGDMTRVVVRAIDANNQVVPTSNAKVSFSVTGPGAVVGESPLTLEAGTGAVYLDALAGPGVTLCGDLPDSGGPTSASPRSPIRWCRRAARTRSASR